MDFYNSEEIQQNYARRSAERQANRERHMTELTDSDFRILNQTYGEESDEEYVNNRYRAASAFKLARMYHLQPTEAMEYLDDFIMAEFPQVASPKSAWKAIADSFALGTNQVKLANMGIQLMALPEGEQRNKLWQEIEAVGKENMELKDGVQRGWMLEGLKGFGESWLFTASAAGAGFLGSLGTPALGIASAAAVSSSNMIGLEYVNLLNEGVDDETARRTAIASGAIQGVLEAFIGDIPALGSRTGLGQLIFRKLHYAGVFGAVARVLGGRVIDSAMEGMEELAQEKVSQIGVENAKQNTEKKVQGLIAQGKPWEEAAEGAAVDLATAAFEEYYKATSESDDRGNLLPRNTPEEKEKDLWESFRIGFLTSLVTGVPIIGRDIAAVHTDAKALRSIREASVTSPDFQTFKALTDDNITFRGMNENTRETRQRELYAAGEKERNRRAEAAKAAQEAAEEADQALTAPEPLPTRAAPARRKADGKLYARITYYNTVSSDLEEARLVVADPATGRKYGGIAFTLHGDSLAVDSVQVEDHVSDRDQVVHDAMVELAQEYPGMAIEWSPVEPADMAIRDQLIAENPRGPEAGIQWFEEDADIAETERAAKVREAIKKSFTNLSEREIRAATSLVYSTARSLGFNPEDVVGNSLNLYTREELLANPDLAKLIKAGDQPSRRVAGGALFVRDGETVNFTTASREFEQNIKAVIFAAENADFSTFVHEWMHFIDVAYIGRSPSHRKLFEEALGKHYDELTVQDREYLARAYEQYLKNGQAPTKGLKGLFQKIAWAMSKALNALKGAIAISPKLRMAFDSLHADTGAQFYEAESSPAQETAASAQGGAVEQPPDMAAQDADSQFYGDLQTVAQGGAQIPAQELDPEPYHDDAVVMFQSGTESREPTAQEIRSAKRQIESVRRQYSDTAAWLMAPNGEPSNLNEQQWLQVRTPAFKAWFGDWENDPESASKVLDENGEPLPLYHQTTSFFEIFETRREGAGTSDQETPYGIFLKDTNKDIGLEGQNQIPLFADIMNPLRVENRQELARLLRETPEYASLDQQLQENNKKYQALLDAADAEEDTAYKKWWEENQKNPEAPYRGSDKTNEILQDWKKANNGIENRMKELVNQYLKDKGYDGIDLKADEGSFGRRVHTTIALENTQIKSATDNAGTFSNDNPSIFFQLSRDAILEEAREFDSWEEWRDYVNTSASWEIGETAQPEGLSGAEADAWYKTTWEEAQGIVRDQSGREIDAAPALTTEQINGMLLEKLEEGRLEPFLEQTYYEQDTDSLEEVVDEMGALEREEATDLKARIESMHPTVLLNAERVARGRQLTPSTRKRILTLIAQGATYYRALYTEITGDQEFAALAEREIKTEPEIIEAPGGPTLSIVEMERNVRKIKNKAIREKYQNGTITEKDALVFIASLDEEIGELKSKVRAAEKELQEDTQIMSRQERAYYEQKTAAEEAENTIRNYEEEIVRLEESLQKIRVKQQLQKQQSEEKLDQLKENERVKRTAQKERENTRREKLEAGYKKRLEETREKLREKRLEAGYKKRLEETREKLREKRAELAHAKAEGMIRKHWALAEQAQKTRKKQAELKKKLQEKQEEKREADKIIAEKRRLLNHIMREPSKSVWHEYRAKIRAIQAAIDPFARRAKVRWEGEQYTLQEFREKAVNENLIDILPKGLAKRLFKKSLDEWTKAELQEMAAEIDGLIAAGKAIWGLKEAERKMAVVRNVQEGIAQFVGDPRYAEPFAYGSRESSEQLKKLDGLVKAAITPSWTLSRIANWLDGGKDRFFTRLLIREERDAYRSKMENVDRRVAHITALMRDLKIGVRDLYEKTHVIHGAGPMGTDATFTVSDLMYMHIGLTDPHTRAAIVYGNFMDNEQRFLLVGRKTGNDLLESIGRAKYRELQTFVTTRLTAEEKRLANEISFDFRDEFGRLNDVFANQFNLVMRKVNSYVPMLRTDATASGEAHEQQQAKEILNVAGVSIQRTPEKGFSVNRIVVPPAFQRAIKLDLYDTWMKAVDRQEHFVAYTGYIRMANGVIKGKSIDSRRLRQRIQQIYGPEALQRLGLEINALANPQSFQDDRNLDRLLRVFRGNLGAAYLSFKMSSVLKQFATSPGPFLAYVNPLDMTKSALAMVRDYKGFSERVRSLSVVMRHREGDIIRQEIKQARETGKGKKKLAAIQDIGMKGLEFADWSCVAVGWNAVYERSLTEGLSEKEAVNKADDAVLQSQPSTREQDLSALFKNNRGAMQLIAPFTTALNVIWNQFTYDLLTAIKNKNYRFAVGMITGYAIAGAMVGLLSQGLRGDDDDEMKPRRLMYWAFSQFFDSVPLIGNGVSALAEYAITGEKPRLYQSAILPAADEIIGAARSVTAGDFDKALQHGGAGVFLIGGGPWSGLKETGRFVGIGDDDGELSLHFEALLGQQIKK